MNCLFFLVGVYIFSVKLSKILRLIVYIILIISKHQIVNTYNNTKSSNH